MIIDFTVKNFLSIKNEITISFSAKKSQDTKAIFLEKENFNLYPLNIVYGPNSSGKSNILKALQVFFDMIDSSYRMPFDALVGGYNPFRLDNESTSVPTKFEIECLIDGTRYKYHIQFNRTTILLEELFFYPLGREALLFKRIVGEEIQYGSHSRGDKKAVEKMLSPNMLYLSKAANSNIEQLQPVYKYFRDAYVFHTRMDSSGKPFHVTTNMIEKKGESFKNRVIKLLNSADFNIIGINIVNDDLDKSVQVNIPEEIPEDLKRAIIKQFTTKPYMGYPTFNNGIQSDTVYFSLEKEESGGTRKLYDMASEILDALDDGKTLIIDEFDSGLHPHITNHIVQIFQDLKINRNGAQLFVVTHDPYLMDNKSLDREQIWFVNKDKYGVTELFSLAEFDKTKLRDDSPFSKWYLSGKLHAVPYILNNPDIATIKAHTLDNSNA